MELKEYKLEEFSGEIYTEDEFLEKYIKEISHPGIIQGEWERMPTVSLASSNIEGVREKMRYLYSKGRPLKSGDIIKKDVVTRYFAYVEYACGRIIVRYSNEITGALEEWRGPYVKLGDYRSFFDIPTPLKIAENK